MMADNSIHPDTTLGYVHLTVTNLDRSLAFYEQALGFRLHRRQDETAYLGGGTVEAFGDASQSVTYELSPNTSPVLALTENPNARRVRGTSGLYHFATLVPSRLALGQLLKHLAETGTPVEGFADHLVSEAIYLSDPDGNGIELYRDRPRSEWRTVNGRLQMATDPLDVEGVLAELEGHTEAWNGLPAQTVLGHMHLHVANVREAEAFYCGILGFDLMLRYGPTASFVSAGGYHHHIAFNTWAGVGAPPPRADAVGLRYFVVRLPSIAELHRVKDRVLKAGLALQETQAGWLVRDPSQNGVVLAAAKAETALERAARDRDHRG